LYSTSWPSVFCFAVSVLTSPLIVALWLSALYSFVTFGSDLSEEVEVSSLVIARPAAS
jgi:hypothetical protein